MSKEKEILQLLSNGDSGRKIASTLGVSRNTVASVLAAAKRTKKSYPELLRLDEQALFQTLFPEKAAEPVLVPPDYEKVHKELMRHGVTLRLLWGRIRGCLQGSKAATVHVILSSASDTPTTLTRTA